MTRSSTKLVGLLTAALTAAALCVGVSAGTASGAARSQTAPQVLKIATIGTTSLYGDMAKGVQARLDDANKNKELPGGRTIEYLGMIDDKSTADGTVAAVRQAKEQDGAFAIVGSINSYLTSEYVNQQKLPWVGWGITDSFCPHGSKTPWYLFSITGCINAVNAAYSGAWPELLAKQLGGAKGKTVACFGDDSPAGKQGVKTGCSSFKVAGFTPVLEEASVPAPPAVVSDWSPYVQKAMTANSGKPADVVGMMFGPGPVLGFQPALTRAGYPGVPTNAVLYSNRVTSLMKGGVVSVAFATAEAASSNPEMQKILASLNRVGISTDQVGLTALVGWYSADMFVKILQKAGKNLTPEAFQKAASKFTYEIKNTIGPTTYPNAFAAPTPCGELVASDGTTWTITQPFQCYSLVETKTGKTVPYEKVNGSKKF